jgi:hypothetical protein
MKKLAVRVGLLYFLAATFFPYPLSTLQAQPMEGFSYRLLIPGHYTRDVLSDDVEGTWVALICAARECSLAETNVHLRDSTYRRFTSDPGVPGAIVETAHRGVVFLLRGEGLKPGPAVTSVLGEVHLTPGESLIVGPASRWSLRASAPRMERTPDGTQFEVFDVRVFDSHSPGTVSLGTWLAPLQISWAGDLNGDDRLDLLLSHSLETGERIWSLHLAGAEGSMQMVAQFHLPGC